MAAKSQTQKYAPSFIVGLLLVPLSAVAAFALVSGEAADADAGPTPESSTTSTVAEAVDVIAAPTTTVVEVDLVAACGDDGMSLVEAEAEESITDLEQAALDALRPICLEAGMELPGPPAPAPVIRTVTVSSGSSSGGDDAASDDTSDDDSRYDDDRDEDDDHDEDEEDEEDEEDDEDDEDDDDEDDG